MTRKSILLFILVAVAIISIPFIHSYILQSTAIPISYRGIISYEDYVGSSIKPIPLECEWSYKTDNIRPYYLTPYEILDNAENGPVSMTLYIRPMQGNKMYGLILPSFNSSYELVINNKVVYACGEYVNSYKQYEPLRIFYFYNESDLIKITLNIIKDDDTAFTYNHLYFGSARTARNLFISNVLLDLVPIIIMTVAAIYFFILSYNNLTEKKYSSFFLFCLGYSINLLFCNTNIISMLIPNIPYTTGTTFYWAFFCWISILIAYHSLCTFPELFSKISFYLISIPSSICSVILLIPYGIMADIGYYFLLACSVITPMVLFYNVIKGLISRAKNSDYYIFSIFILLISNIIDSFVSNSGTTYTYATTCGCLFFVSQQTYVFLVASTKVYFEEKALYDSYNETIDSIRKEETNYLSSHLKPHFLFNALNVISGYALFEPSIAQEVTKSLIIYLKQLFEHDNLNEMNSLGNEIELVKAFGYIENQRFPSINIDYDIDIKDQDIKVPALILQPLLENSINNGIRKKKKAEGNTNIRIKEEENAISFEIQDDGIGMDTEIIEKALSEPTDNKFHSLYHLSLRLKELYNEKLYVESIPGKMTTIRFSIPIRNH